MTGRIQAWLIPGTLLAVLLGGFLGYQMPYVMVALGFIGRLFVSTLSITFFVLLSAGVVLGISQLGNHQKLFRAGGKALLYFLVVGLVASGLGVAAFELIRPGTGVVADMTDLHQNWAPRMIDMAPLWVYVGLILFCIAFGGALTRFGTRAKAVANLLIQVHQALMKVVTTLLYLAPAGLLFLVGDHVASSQLTTSSILATSLSYSATVLSALLFFGFVILPIALRVLGRRSGFRLFGSVSPAMLTAFGVSSSLSALPFTYHGVVEGQAVDSRAAALVLPSGAILNTGVTALCAVVATLFIAQVGDVNLSVVQYGLIVLLPLFLAVGVAGLPQPLLPILLILFAVVGMPPHAYALIGMVLVVDWLIDRFRSAFNVWSDSVGAAIIAETFEFKTARTLTRDRAPVRSKYAPSRGRPNGYRPQRGERRVSQRPSAGPPAKRLSGKPVARRPQPPHKPAVREETTSPFDMSATDPPTFDIDLSQPSPVDEKKQGAISESPVVTPSQRYRSGESRSRENRSGTSRPRSEHGHHRRERSVTKPVQTETGSESGAEDRGRLSPETIARELARVSAQLGSHQSGNDTHRESRGKPQDQKTGLDSDSLGKGDSTAETIDVAGGANDSEPAEVKPTASTQEQVEVTVTSNGTQGKPDVTQYGRSRSRRVAKPRTDHPEADEPSTDIPEPKDSFSSEGISFGRGKRKRTR